MSRTERFYINCPYDDRHEAKDLGAKWDKDRRSWYVPMSKAIEPFRKWFPRSIFIQPANEWGGAPWDHKIICPVCGFHYMRLHDLKVNDQNDAGTKHDIELRFTGECGHDFTLDFHFHKGETYVGVANIETWSHENYSDA